jgi:hypothetical protein
MTLSGICRCCEQPRELRVSHVVSALAIRKLKRFRGPGRLVADEGTRVVQDGEKRHLLCSDCELDLAEAERLFNERFLTPYYKAPHFRVEYGPWLARFVAANVFRSLIAQLEDGEVPSSTASVARAATRAWRAFLRGEAATEEGFDLHVILVDNRPEWAAYADGVVEYGMFASADDAYVVVKIPGLLLVGVLTEDVNAAWRDTQVDLRAGTLDSRDVADWPEPVARYVRSRVEVARQHTMVDWIAASP